MAVSKIKVVIHAELHKVWDRVTTVEQYHTWRSDLSRAERQNETEFVEYTKDGHATHFHITAEEPDQRWAFDLENDQIQGHWVGIFTAKEEKTEIEFTEDVTAKKLWMRPLVKGYLQKQQAQFVSDLRAAVQ